MIQLENFRLKRDNSLNITLNYNQKHTQTRVLILEIIKLIILFVIQKLIKQFLQDKIYFPRFLFYPFKKILTLLTT